MKASVKKSKYKWGQFKTDYDLIELKAKQGDPISMVKWGWHCGAMRPDYEEDIYWYRKVFEVPAIKNLFENWEIQKGLKENTRLLEAIISAGYHLGIWYRFSSDPNELESAKKYFLWAYKAKQQLGKDDGVTAEDILKEYYEVEDRILEISASPDNFGTEDMI